MKASLKGELLRSVIRRYPDLNLELIEVITQIQSISRSLSAHLSHQLAEHGLTEGKFYVLLYLFSEELAGHQPPGPSDIADNLGVTRGTITGLLDGLERDDYLERHNDSRDRRALTIWMTDKARQFLDRFMQESTQLFNRIISLDEAEKHSLLGSLERFQSGLQVAGFPVEEGCCPLE